MTRIMYTDIQTEPRNAKENAKHTGLHKPDFLSHAVISSSLQAFCSTRSSRKGSRALSSDCLTTRTLLSDCRMAGMTESSRK